MPKRTKRRRWRNCLLAVLLAGAAALTGLWLSLGFFLSMAAAVATGAREIEIDHFRAGPTTRIGRIALYPPKEFTPLFKLEEIRVPLHPWRPHRPLGVIEAERGAVWLVRTGNTMNYSFLLPEQQSHGDTGSGSVRWMPEGVRIDALGLSFMGGDGRYIESLGRISGLSLDAELRSRSDMRVTLAGKDFTVADVPGIEEAQMGNLDLTLRYAPDDLRADPIRAEIPGLFEAEAVARYVPASGRFEFDAAYLEAAHAVLAPWIVAATDTSIAFDHVSLRDTQVFGAYAEGSLQDVWVRLDAAAEGLRIGPAQAPWWMGTLSAQGELDEEGGTVVLNPEAAPAVAVSTRGGWTEPSFAVKTPPWTRAQWTARSPAVAGRVFGTLEGVQSFGLDAEIALREGALAVAGSSSIGLEGGQGMLDFEGTAAAEGGWFDGRMTLDVPGGSMGGPIVLGPGELDGNLSVDGVLVQPFVRALFAMEAALPKDLALSGSVVPGGKPAVPDASIDLAWEAFTFRGFHIPASPLRGDLRFSHVGLEGALEAQAAHHRIALGGIKYLSAPKTLQTQASCELDFNALPALFDSDALTGRLDMTGNMHYGAGALSFEGGVRWEEPFTEAFLAPGATLLASANVRFHPEAQRLHVARLAASWGEDDRTTLTMEPGEISFQGAESQLGWTLRSDLTPLADLGYVEQTAGGEVLIEGAIIGGAGDLSVQFAGSIAADEVAVLGAAVEGLDMQGSFTVSANSLSGDGALRGAAVSYGSWDLGDLSVDLRASDGQLFCSAFEAAFLDGHIEGKGALTPFAPKMPGSADLTLESLDLAALSKRLDVEDVQLTGTAQGAGYAAWNLDGLVDLQLLLEAPEGLTIGRALLERLLLGRTLTTGLTASTIRVIREDILGEAEAKTFDSARLDLHYRDARFVGPLELRSSNLNLTIDLDVEERALAEALALGGEAGSGQLSVSVE